LGFSHLAFPLLLFRLCFVYKFCGFTERFIYLKVYYYKVVKKMLTKEKCPACGSQMWLITINATSEKAAAKLRCHWCGATFEKDLQTGEIKFLYNAKPSLNSQEERFIRRVLRDAKLL